MDGGWLHKSPRFNDDVNTYLYVLHNPSCLYVDTYFFNKFME